MAPAPTASRTAHKDDLIAVRVPHALALEVRRLAAAEQESTAVILRRAIKRGLRHADRDGDGAA
jgi:hypothetical protein